MTTNEATSLVCEAAERFGAITGGLGRDANLAEAIAILRARLPWAWQQ